VVDIFLTSVRVAGLWQMTAQPRFTFATELQTAEIGVPMRYLLLSISSHFSMTFLYIGTYFCDWLPSWPYRAFERSLLASQMPLSHLGGSSKPRASVRRSWVCPARGSGSRRDHRGRTDPMPRLPRVAAGQRRGQHTPTTRCRWAQPAIAHAAASSPLSSGTEPGRSRLSAVRCDRTTQQGAERCLLCHAAVERHLCNSHVPLRNSGRRHIL